jgi:hypothetical protein
MRAVFLALALLPASITPAQAQYRLIPQGVPVIINNSALQVTPNTAWNRLSAKEGKRTETWTLDGTELNDVTYFTGIKPGTTLVADRERATRPLPRFSKTMLPPDIGQLFERTYRIVFQTSRMSIDSMEPARFAGQEGFRFTFSFSREHEVVRRHGEVSGAIVNGDLYMISFEAPAIHYFNRDLPAYRAIVASAFIVLTPATAGAKIKSKTPSAAN